MNVKSYGLFIRFVNPTKLIGCFIYHDVSYTKPQHSAHRVHLCALWESQNKEEFFHYAVSIDMFLTDIHRFLSVV